MVTVIISIKVPGFGLDEDNDDDNYGDGDDDVPDGDYSDDDYCDGDYIKIKLPRFGLGAKSHHRCHSPPCSSGWC